MQISMIVIDAQFLEHLVVRTDGSGSSPMVTLVLHQLLDNYNLFTFAAEQKQPGQLF